MDYRPVFHNLEYEKPKDIQQMSIRQFTDRLSEIPSESRFVIAFPQNGSLWFPDEAVGSLRRTYDEKNLELMSGYYEENPVITSQMIDVNQIHRLLADDALVFANTKRYGKRKVLDIFPFTKEYLGRTYNLIAIVTD